MLELLQGDLGSESQLFWFGNWDYPGVEDIRDGTDPGEWILSFLLLRHIVLSKSPSFTFLGPITSVRVSV